MKLYPLTILTVFTSLTATQVQATLTVYEGFDYADGSIHNQAGGIGWNTIIKPNGPGDPSPTVRDVAAWGSYPLGESFAGNHQGVGVLGSSAPQVVQASTLSTPSNYGFTPTGKELYGNFNYADSFREFAPENYINMDSGSPVYFSYLTSIDNLDVGFGSSYSLLRFIAGNRDDLFQVGIGVGLDTAAIEYSNGIGSGTVIGQAVAEKTSYLFVGKIVPGGVSSSISVSVFDSTEAITAEGVWEMSDTVDLSGYVIDRIGTLSGGFEGGVDTAAEQTRRGHFDEIRLGTTYFDVTGVVIPEPSALGLGIGLLALGTVLVRRRT